jgi:hypothetical protein
MTLTINGTTGIDNIAVDANVANTGNFTTINLSTGVLSSNIGQNLTFGTGNSNQLQIDLNGNVKLLTSGATLQNSIGQNYSPYHLKNKVINGSFDIWQRGTTQTISGYGSDDRWNNQHLGSTKTHTRQAFTLGQTDVSDNPKYYSRTTITSVADSNNFTAKSHSIENVLKSAGKTYTLSFWAKADTSKNIAVEFFQNFGTGGSPSAQVSALGVTTFALTTTWQKFTTTVTFPSIAGKKLGTNNNDTFGFTIYFEAGSNYNSRTNSLGQQSGTFDIAQTQLEEGYVATEFETRPVGFELQQCQRYFEVIGGVNNALTGIGYGASSGTGGARCNISFKALKRTTPTVTKLGTWLVSNVGQPTANFVSTSSLTLDAVSTGTSVGCSFQCDSTDDLITIDAETNV